VTKYFKFLADHKTVRQINNKEYYKLTTDDPDRLICFVTKSEVAFRKGECYIAIPLAQLNQILKKETP
jgi:hypothetical protein